MEEKRTSSLLINNDFYDDLEEGWYTRNDHPIALLRKENELRIPWILSTLENPVKVLDIGCGAGFLTNALAQKGHIVTGVDLSEKSLDTARFHDQTQKVHYLKADAYSLPFKEREFDVVCAMDILEHVDNPKKLIKEAARVLKPGGKFFFHTFNRNPISYLFIIKGVDWFVKNAPKNMHVYPLFIKPKELQTYLFEEGLNIKEIKGFRPKIFSKAFFKLVITKSVPPDYSFTFCKSQLTGYCGYAFKDDFDKNR